MRTVESGSAVNPFMRDWKKYVRLDNSITDWSVGGPPVLSRRLPRKYYSLGLVGCLASPCVGLIVRKSGPLMVVAEPHLEGTTRWERPE